mmetsp:Transcript_9413/g.28640  ORF Transcript_9413/g.28640 Transcript_9413/m.28640 type:complete len:124 (+) Transcript_9413:2696-3067(+)
MHAASSKRDRRQSLEASAGPQPQRATSYLFAAVYVIWPPSCEVGFSRTRPPTSKLFKARTCAFATDAPEKTWGRGGEASGSSGAPHESDSDASPPPEGEDDEDDEGVAHDVSLLLRLRRRHGL